MSPCTSTTALEQGWVETVSRVVHPDPGDPSALVLSSSWYILNGDDGVSPSVSPPPRHAVGQAFEDAAIQGVTICIAWATPVGLEARRWQGIHRVPGERSVGVVDVVGRRSAT